MQAKRNLLTAVVVLIAASMLVSGCALNFYKQSPRSKKKIKDLESKISDLEAQRAQEQREFEETKKLLERKFKTQISDDQIGLRLTKDGLVIVLSDDILFDSGKADLKKAAYPVLDKVIAIIKKKVPDKNIGVSGHTDNVPITYSKWKSNWELSSARATNVLYYLEGKGIPPKQLSATGYGEHRPIASNDTAAGRSKNRRVEIVILPDYAEEKETTSKNVK
ncbi:OmpA family protein [Candidatus Omnitrophota bacterium]